MARNQRKQQWRRHESSLAAKEKHIARTPPPSPLAHSARTMENYKFNVCQLWMHLTPRARTPLHTSSVQTNEFSVIVFVSSLTLRLVVNLICVLIATHFEHALFFLASFFSPFLFCFRSKRCICNEYSKSSVSSQSHAAIGVAFVGACTVVGADPYTLHNIFNTRARAQAKTKTWNLFA